MGLSSSTKNKDFEIFLKQIANLKKRVLRYISIKIYFYGCESRFLVIVLSSVSGQLNFMKLRLLIGLILISIIATLTTDSIANIPSIHLLLLGKIELRRSSQTEYRPVEAPLPVRLNPDDSIRYPKGKSFNVLCSSLKLKKIKANSDTETNMIDICPSVEKVVLSYEGSNFGSTRSGGTDRLIPYIINPRKTKILNNKPLLRWNEVPNASSYTVRLRDSSGVIWEEQVSNTEIPYAGNPPLKPGENYSMVILANNNTSSQNEGIFGLAFSLLDADKAQEVNTAIAKIFQQELPPEVRAITLVHLYRSYDLIAQAIKSLEMLVEQGTETTLVYKLLGDSYRQIRLNLLAKDSYLKAFKLAKAEDIELKAEVQASLGEVYIILKDIEKAIKLFDEALLKYKFLGDSEQVKNLHQKLDNLTQSRIGARQN